MAEYNSLIGEALVSIELPPDATDISVSAVEEGTQQNEIVVAFSSGVPLDQMIRRAIKSDPNATISELQGGARNLLLHEAKTLITFAGRSMKKEFAEFAQAKTTRVFSVLEGNVVVLWKEEEARYLVVVDG